MTDFFGVTAIADVEEKLRAVARRADLRRQAEEAEHEILDALRATSIGAAEALLDEADHAALDAELAELQARFEDHDKRVRELFAEYCKAEDSLAAIGGDAAVAQLEEQRTTVLLEIEDGAHTFLKLRAGIAAAERALRAYRQQHRSAMMARASEVFRAISENAYTGLASQPEQDREVLVALPAEGGSKIATELSKGTRFQLYLALRVAGYHEFVAHREPVPFIADDILETFDNPRSAATFRVFAGMGQVGQVIYLTHHQHLCDIATNACPGVRVHTLQP
jgi:uncharacterized protein YhaN